MSVVVIDRSFVEATGLNQDNFSAVLVNLKNIPNSEGLVLEKLWRRGFLTSQHQQALLKALGTKRAAA